MSGAGAGPVGVGVIGAGNISTQYLTTLTTLPDLRVLFVADLDLERAGAQAAAFGIAGHGSVDELLAHDDIEIVVNLTIPAVHAEVGQRILAAAPQALRVIEFDAYAGDVFEGIAESFSWLTANDGAAR